MSVRDFPRIRRARGYRLYDTRGNRYLDMYLDNGRAILGHDPGRTIKALKNGLEKSTLGEYPSIYPSRLLKAAAELLPGHPEIRVYRSHHRLREALGLGGDEILEPVRLFAAEVKDAADPPAGGLISYWRPLLAEESRYPDVIIPILPLPGEFVPQLICGREGTLPESLESDICSPVLCAALTRSVYDLIAFIDTNRGREYPEFDLPGMYRRGCYLYPVCGENEYRPLVEHLKKGGVLLNPDYRGVSIAPAEYTGGEIKVFSRIAEGKEVWT
jgi:hypothetical protein